MSLCYWSSVSHQCILMCLPREKNLIANRLVKLWLTWKSSLQIPNMPSNEMMGSFNRTLLVLMFDFVIWINCMFLFTKKKRSRTKSRRSFSDSNCYSHLSSPLVTSSLVKTLRPCLLCFALLYISSCLNKSRLLID